jgi:hypothetical protein
MFDLPQSHNLLRCRLDKKAIKLLQNFSFSLIITNDSNSLKQITMKYILLSLAIIITMVACQSKPDTQDQTLIPITPVYNNSALSDTAMTDAMEPNFAESRPKRAVKQTVRTAVHRNVTPETTHQPPIQTPPVVTPVPTSPDVNTVPSSTSGSDNAGTGTTSTIPQPVEKKGWSKAAKGAVIGGVTGAIGGAVLSKKKKGLGAVIGGVIGAAGGYAIGKGMDKKDNRYVVN